MLKRVVRRFFNFLLVGVTLIGCMPASSTMAATMASDNAPYIPHIDVRINTTFNYLQKNGDGSYTKKTTNLKIDDSTIDNLKVYLLDNNDPNDKILISDKLTRIKQSENGGEYRFLSKHVSVDGRSSWSTPVESLPHFLKNADGTWNKNIEQLYLLEYTFVDPATQKEFTLTNYYSYSLNNVCPGLSNYKVGNDTYHYHGKYDDPNGELLDKNANLKWKGIDMKLDMSALTNVEITKTLVTAENTDKAFDFVIKDTAGKETDVTVVVPAGSTSATVSKPMFINGNYTISEKSSEDYRLVSAEGERAYYGGNRVKTEKLTADEGVISFNANGSLENIAFNFTNASLASLVVKKAWSNVDGQELPSAVELELMANGENTGKTVRLTVDGNWTGVFENLDRIDSEGNPIEYAVTETAIDGKNLENGAVVYVNGDGSLAGKYESNVSGDKENGYTVTNTWVDATNVDENSDKTKFTLKKVAAEDEAIALSNAEFELRKDGEVAAKKTTSENGEILFDELAEGEYSLIETKAPIDYVKIAEPITIKIEREHRFVRADENTLTNTYHNYFTVTVDDPSDSSYNSTAGVMTVKDKLETVEVNVEKKWQSGDAARPNYVEMQLYGNDEKVGDAVRVSESNGWKHTWTELRKSIGGENIDYVVKEVKVFGASDNGFIVYDTETTSDGVKAVKGKWDASEAKLDGSWTVTNKWMSANYRYDGSTEFFIEKIDNNGNALAGVEFEINGEKKITDADGKIKVEIPEDLLMKDGTKRFEIVEKETKEGYDLDEDKAVLDVTIESNLNRVDEINLINYYEKAFTFVASGNENYIWNGETRTFVLTNQRSLAKSLTIEKTFEGVSEEALKNNRLSFTIAGPDDFETKTVNFDEFEVNGNVAKFELTNLPTGEYTVTESNAEFEGLFTLETSGDTTKTLSKNAEETVKITNSYAPVKNAKYAVEKVWDDDNNRDGKRPEKLTINLLADGAKVGTVELNEENDWKYEWTGLTVANSDAVMIEYSVVEEDVEDYMSTDERFGDKTIFTNTHAPELIKEDDDDPENDGRLDVTKIWEDNKNALNTRPLTVTVYLYANGEKIATKDIVPMQDGSWSCVFEGLYKYENGEEIEYMVEEKETIGYKATYERNGYDYTILNTSTNPCVFGGCGRAPESPKVKMPDTGANTTDNSGASASLSVAAITAIAAVTLAGAAVFTKRK